MSAFDMASLSNSIMNVVYNLLFSLLPLIFSLCVVKLLLDMFEDFRE